MTDTFIPDPSHGTFDEDAEAQEYARFHELSNRMQYITTSAPYLANDPEVLSAIAQMPVPTDQLGYLAGAASAQIRLDGTRADLERMEPGRARRVFAMLTKEQQEALTSQGYQAPGTDDGGGSNPLLDFVGKGGGMLLSGVNTVLTEAPVVSNVFDLMNKLDNGVKTLYRQIRTDDFSTLATLGMVAGGVIAAPFTGGLSLGATAGIIAGGALAGGTAIALATNPSDYIATLDDNWNGEAVFTRGAQERVRQLLGESGLDAMARDIGWEMDAFETVKLFASTREATSDQAFVASIERVLDRVVEPGDPRREELAGKLMNLITVPEFRESIEVLEHSKTSFGRDVARWLGVDHGSALHNVISGGADAFFTIVTDPTLAAGAWFKWNRARRLGMPIADDEDVFLTIDAISRRAEAVPTIGRAYDEIANAVNADAPHLMWRRVKHAKGMYDDLWNYKRLLQEQGELTGEFTREHIFDWMKDGQNFQMMLKGHGVKPGYGRLMLPTYGWRVPFTQSTVAPVGKTLEGVKAFIDFADDAGNQAHLRKIARKLERLADKGEAGLVAVDPTAQRQVRGALRYSMSPDDEWRHMRQFVELVDHLPVVNRLVRTMGSIGASFTEMMPATRSISMVGPQAAEDIQRMVSLGRSMGMTSLERKAWFDTIMQQENIEHRINAALSFLDTMISAGGVRSSERGVQLTDKFVGKIRQRYSLGEADQYLFGERTASRALHPYQHSFDLPIPDFKELRQYSEKSLLLKYVYKAVDVAPVDYAVNKIWKPAVLLRLGFITRAGGEELLALLARSGPSAILAEFGGRAIAEGRLHRSAQEAAKQLAYLTDDQVRAIERMRYVAHVRPLERMLNAFEWTRPANDILRRYSDFLRNSLEHGLIPGLTDRLPASRQLAIVGKEGGWRRSLLTGVDERVIRNAESFGRKHSASIMREMSAQNANIWSGDTIRDKSDFRHRYIDQSGELQELGFAIERGKFKVYRRGDPMFDRAAQGGARAIAEDTVTGPVFTDTTSRWAPDTISDEEAYAGLALYKSIHDGRVRGVLDELLTHTDGRTVNWESLLRRMSTDPHLGDMLRAAHRTIGEAPEQADAVLATMRKWVRQHYSRGTRLSNTGQGLMDQLDSATEILRSISSVDRQSQHWLGQFLARWGDEPGMPDLIRGYDNYVAELNARWVDRHYAVEVQPLVQDLTYANRLPDGTFVARPPQEGRTRLWVSEVTAETYGALLRELAESTAQDVVERLMAMWSDAQPHLSGLHIAQADRAMRRFLERMLADDPQRLLAHAADVEAGARHGTLIPLAHMGFDDPDVAMRFSQFLNGVMSRKGDELSMAARMRDNRGFVGVLDLDDHLRNYWPTDIDGAKHPVAYQAERDVVGVVEPSRATTYDETNIVPVEYPDIPATGLPAKQVAPSPIAPEGWTEFFDPQQVWTRETLANLDPNTVEFHFIGGGRDYRGIDEMRVHLRRAQQEAAKRGKRLVLIHGDAKGADRLAMRTAETMGIDSIAFPADWNRHNKAAGAIRNGEMAAFLNEAKLAGFQVGAVLFPGGRGTANMRKALDTVQIRPYAPATAVLAETAEVTTQVTDVLPEVRGVIGTVPNTTERTLHSWALDREYLTPRVVSMNEGMPVDLPDGTRQVGVDPRDALASGAERAVKDWLDHIGPGTTQQRIVTGRVYRDPDGMNQIPIGTRLNVRDDAYNAKGVLLEYDDPQAFKLLDAAHGTDVHQNWSYVGPLLRDASDHHKGIAHLVPDTRDIRNLPEEVRAARAELAPGGGPDAREFRSHWSHVAELDNPPMVAVGPTFVPVESPGRWDRVLEFAFERVISPSIDAIVRRPMAFHMYNEAMLEGSRAARWMLPKHLFGDEETGTAGELANKFSHQLEHANFRVSNTELADNALAVTKVLMPDVYAELAHLPSDEIVSAFYGQYPDDIIFKGSLGQQVKTAEDALDREVAIHVQKVWEDALNDPDSYIGHAVTDAFNRTRGPKPRRLYRKGNGDWTPTKPRNLDDVVYVEVPADRVSSTLADLNGPRPSKDLPKPAEIRRRAKQIRDDLVRQAEDVVEAMTGGARPSMVGGEYRNTMHQRGRYRGHIYGREGYTRGRQAGGLAPDQFAQDMEHLGFAYGTIDEALDAYFKAVENVMQMRLRSNDLAISTVADELGMDYDLVESAVLQDASTFRAAAGDVPAREHGVARPADGAPPIEASGPSQRHIIKVLENYAATGVMPPGWEAVLGRVQPSMFRTGWQRAAQHIDTFEMLGAHTLGEWREAVIAGAKAMETPRWSIPVRANRERPAEGLLDAYEHYLGDTLGRSYTEASRSFSDLPEALAEGLDEDHWAVLSSAYKYRARMTETLEDLAADRAIRNSLPYIDSHEIRSQAGEYVKGFFPFMYAEENFLKRWARTLVVAPDALRKGQLIYMGLKNGGVIRTDSQGRDWFVYPGAGLVAETVNRSTQALGWGEVMPSGVVFQTETKNMLPGFDTERTGMPSANPLVAMSVAGLTGMFHELRPIQEALVGQVGVTQGGVRQFIPASLRRLWDVVGDEESNVKYASTMVSVMAIMEHNGHGLPEDATPYQVDEYVRRVRNHTRGILAAQAFVGFVAPGAPSTSFTGESQFSLGNLVGLQTEIPADIFRHEYIEMVQEFGIDEGTIRYFELNPDHSIEDLLAFTVGQSESSTGAPLPATAEAVRFAEENEGWMNQYPMAAAWLLPQPDPAADEVFDEYAYTQQAITGLRTRRTPREFMDALMYKEGSLEYFEAREQHERLLAEAADNPMRRNQLEDIWQTFKARHEAMHPIFAMQLGEGEARVRRQQVIDQLRTATQDPATPDVRQLAPMRDMIESYDFYKVQLSQMSESRSAEDVARVQRFKQRYEDLVGAYILDHPELEPLWLSVLRPEASL